MAVTSRDMGGGGGGGGGGTSGRRCHLLSPSETMVPCKVSNGETEDLGYKMRIVSIKQLNYRSELSRLTSMDTETPSDSAMRHSPTCASEDNQVSMRRMMEWQDELFRKWTECHEELIKNLVKHHDSMYKMIHSELRNSNGKRPHPDEEEVDVDTYHDQELVKWLRTHGFMEDDMKKVLREKFFLDDLLKMVTYDDLRDLDLKAGPRVRLWKCIEQSRQKMSNGVS